MEDVQDGIKVSIQDGVTEDPAKIVLGKSGVMKFYMVKETVTPKIECVGKIETVTPKIATITLINQVAVT